VSKEGTNSNVGHVGSKPRLYGVEARNESARSEEKAVKKSGTHDPGLEEVNRR
jgi:hypothetical protein